MKEKPLVEKQYENETYSRTHDWVSIPNRLLALCKGDNEINKYVVLHDASWHHDGLPSFAFGPFVSHDDNEYYSHHKYLVWVNTHDKDHPWRDTEYRFNVQTSGPACPEMILNTDSLDELIEFIRNNNELV